MAANADAGQCWRGGGTKGWTSRIGSPGETSTTEFAEFEERLIDHKQRFFADKPFPYMPQSSEVWSFYGPYGNNGDLFASFAPEKGDAILNTKIAFRSVGGTQVLRHWWYPLVKGVVEKSEENTTWYAETKIWSDCDTIRPFWIGFTNPSRSYATDSPAEGSWDDKKSWIRINGNIIAPPAWQHAGMKGNLEIPLQDESYEYRPPILLFLHKGWNTVLVKLPAGTFTGKDGGNPVKWMFTFIEADDSENQNNL